MGARDIAVNIIERVQGSGAISRVEGDLKKLGPAGNIAATGMDRFTSFLTGRLGIASGAAKKGLDGLTASAVGTGSALSGGVVAGAAAGAAAAATLFHVVKDGVQEFVNLTSQARALQRVTGATAEDASTLAAVMRVLGIDVGAATTFFGRLEKNIGTNEKALTDLGVTVARDRDGNTDFYKTLINISSAYQSHTDQAQKAAIASAAFGRGYIELLPLLGKNREELKALAEEAAKHHEVFDQGQLEAGRDFQISVRELHSELGGLSAEVGSAVVPSLADFVAGITALIEKADQLGHALARDFGLTLIPKQAQPILFGLVGLITFLGSKSHEAGRAQAELTQQMEENAKAAADEAKALADLNTQAEAPLKLADANDRLAQAVQKLRDAEAENPADDLRRANEDLQGSQLSRRQAVNSLADAEEHLADVQRQAKDNALELRRAELSLRESAQSLRDSQKAAAEAQAELNRLRSDTASTPQQLADAEQKLGDARLGVDEATQQQADSQQALNDLRDPKKNHDLRDAELQVAQAKLGVQKAEDAIADAQKKVDDLHRVDKAHDIAAAERGVEEAAFDVAKAAGASAADQIRAWQSIDTFLTQSFGPRFHQFVLDRESDLDTFNGKIAETNQGLAGLLNIISGQQPAPGSAGQPAPGAGTLAPLFPGVPAPAPATGPGLGAIQAPAITGSGSDTGGSRPASDRGFTQINHYTVNAKFDDLATTIRQTRELASRRALLTG